MTRIALLQARSGIDPQANAHLLQAAIAEAADGGASILFTPEMSNVLDKDRARAERSIRGMEEDQAVSVARQAAAHHGLWVQLGSVALKNNAGRWINRSLLIDPTGEIRARYDKVHLFDVDLPTGERWRESAVYSAGAELVRSSDTPVGRLGFSICYDLRFGGFFDALAKDGAVDAITVPAAFTVPTGKAHWKPLLRARAIESQCFVIAAAQCGVHEDGRETYGHSMVVDPWGEVLLDMGAGNGIGFVDLDLSRVDEVRTAVPKHQHRIDPTRLTERSVRD